MATKKTIQRLTAAIALAVMAATAHGVFVAPTEAVTVAPAAGIRLSTWDPYENQWSIYFVEEQLADVVNNPDGTIRHSEGQIIELRPVSGEVTFDLMPAGLAYTVINDLNALEITAPGEVPVDKQGTEQPQLTASGTPVYIQLGVSTVQTSVPPPVGHTGPWAGPLDPTDDDLSALDSGGSVGTHSVTLGATGDTVSFTWDIGRWAKGDLFLGVNNHTYKVLDRNGNFKRFVAVSDLDDPDHAAFEWYNETSGCATNWKTGEMFAANFGDGMPAVNVIARHPDGAGRTLYSPIDRRVSTRIERPDMWSWWGIDANPESVAFDGDLNMYVGHSGGNQDDRPTTGDQAYWAGLDYDMFNDTQWYPMAVDGNPRQWADNSYGVIVDETGAKIKLAEAGEPFASYVTKIMPQVSPRMQYSGTSLVFGPAPPAIPGLPDWPAQLPLGYLSNPINGNPYQRLDANDVIVEGLVPARWSMGRRMHRYNIQPDGSYLGTGVAPADRDVFWTFTGRGGTDLMDVNSTGDVVYYTSEDSYIHRYRVRLNPDFPDEAIGQLPDLGNGRINVGGSLDRRFHGLRMLPPGDGTGGFLVASLGAIHRLRADGSWVQSYTISNDTYLLEKNGPNGSNVTGWYSLEVDPGGRTLWVAAQDTGFVYVFDIATGRELSRYEAIKHRSFNHPDGPPRFVYSMCMMWEYTAAQEVCANGIDDDGDGFVDENCKAIEICSASSPGDDNGDGLADANDPDCGADLAPVAVNDIFETVQDTQLDVLPAAINQVLKNDSDPDNADLLNPSRHDVLTVAKVATSGDPTEDAGTEILTTQGGTVTLHANGTMTYVPPFFFHGIDTFVYNVTDAVIPFEGQNFSNTATVTIIVRPIVAGDVYYTPQGVAIDTNTLPANQQMLFNDPSGGLQVSAAGPFGVTYLNANPSISFVTANGGNVEVFRTGRFIYTPSPTFIGTDHFKYRGNDDVSDSINDAVVVIIVEPVSTTIVTTDPDPSVYGTPATVRATVTCGLNQSPSVGTVTFRLGAQVIATNVPVVNGVATTTLPASLVVGNHTVTADYSGSASVAPLCPGSGDDDPHQVVPKPATVTANAQTKPYGTVFSFNGTEFTTDGFIFEDEVLSATLVSATGSPASATVAGSTYPIVPSQAVGVGLENYTITYIDGPLTVTPVPLTITALDRSKVYGQVVAFDSPELATDFTVTGLVNGEVITSATLASTGSPATATVPGSTYPITIEAAVTTADFNNYVVTYVPGALTVTPAPLTVTAHDKTKVVDEPLPVLDGVWAGFINGDTVDNIYTTTAIQNSPAGSYPITPEPDLDDPILLNYTLTIVPGTLTVTPKSIDVVAQPVCIADTPYVNFTVSATNFTPEVGEDIVLRWKDSTGAVVLTQTFVWTNVSAPFSQQVLWPGAVVDGNGVVVDWPGWIFNGTEWVVGNDGFQLTRPTSTVEIEVNPTTSIQVSYPPPTPNCDPAPPKTPTIVATGGVFPYDGQPHAATCSVTGADGESLPGVLTYDDFGANAPVNVGTYPATCTFSGDADYVPMTATATVTITPRPLTITADDKSKTYDGQIFPGPYTVTYSGFVNDEDPSDLDGALTFSGTALPAVNAGTYSDGIVPAGFTSTNYAITYVAGTLRIDPPVLIVTAEDKSKTYDGTAYSPFTVTYSGFVGDDDPSDLGGALTFSGVATTEVNAGTYTDGIVPGGYTSSNYTIQYVAGTLAITPVPLVVTAEDKAKVYDGAVYSPFTVTYSGFVGDDDVSDLGGGLTFAGAATTAVNVGTYTDGIVPAGYTSSNYTITYEPGTLSITPVALVVTAQDKSKSYDGTVYSPFTVTYSGFVAGDDAGDLGGALVFSGAATTAVNVGTYTDGIVPAGYTSTNYTITYEPGTLTINPIPLTVRAHDKTIFAGDPIPTLDGVWTGFLAGESVAAVYTTTAPNGNTTGTFPITPNPDASPVLANYTLTIIPGTLTVLPRPSTCSATGYVTYSQGGWGSKPNGGNPGALLAANFATVYPGGVAQIGGTHKLTFTSAAAIENYLPAGGQAKVLTSSKTNPTSSYGVLSAQLLALQLAADFSRAGVLQSGLGAMVMKSGPMAGHDIDSILVMANQVFGGDTGALPSGMSLSGLASLLESIIMNYHEGADGGLLECGTGVPACSVAAFSFSGNSPTSGSMGNIRTFTGGSASVKVSGFSRTTGVSATWAPAYVGVWSEGLGVTDSAEGDGSSDKHKLDNSGRVNYLLFEFSQPVVVTRAYLASIGADSDATVWVGTRNDPFNNHVTLSDAVLATFSAAEHTSGGSAAGWTSFNGSDVAGNILVIAARTDHTNDAFKVKTLDADCADTSSEPLALVVKIDDKVKTYGDPDPELTYAIIEGGPVEPGVLSGTIARVTGEPVGEYAIDAGTLEATPNYTLTVIPGTLTVLPRPAVVTAGTGTKVYGTSDPALTAVTTTGFLGADVPSITLGQSRAAGETVQSYVTTATASGSVLSNYSVTYVAGTFSITPAPLTITANNKSKVQNTPNPTLDGTVAGLVGGDVITASYTTTAVTSSPVGTYPITPAPVDSQNRIGNYTVTIVPGTLTVTSSTPVCTVRTVVLNQSSSGSGSAGNVRTFVEGGVTVKVGAFSRLKSSNSWAPGFVGAFGSAGLGVTDGSEDGYSTSHTLDNNGRNNYLVFVFSEPVAVSRAYLGYVSGDSDAQFWVGTLPGAYPSMPTLNDAAIASLGAVETSSGGSSARWASFNGATVTGNVLVVAAKTDESNDYFKVAKLDFSTCGVPPTPEPPPGGGEVCYIGSASPWVGATQSWVNNGNGTITIRTSLSRSFVDNTYGTGQIGWPGNNHSFNHLVGSDKIQVALFDASGAKKLEAELDYLSAVSGAPGGYKSLGVTGGDGGMVSGSASDVVSVHTSMAENFSRGYALTTNSPATDAAYTTNATYPDWIFDVWYEVTVRASAFGSAGFGHARLTDMHASPSKTGANSEPVALRSCSTPLGTPPATGGGSDKSSKSDKSSSKSGKSGKSGKSSYSDKSSKSGKSSYSDKSSKSGKSSYSDKSSKSGKSSYSDKSSKSYKSSYSDKSSKSDKNSYGDKSSKGSSKSNKSWK